jgi:hypothetical protein
MDVIGQQGPVITEIVVPLPPIYRERPPDDQRHGDEV